MIVILLLYIVILLIVGYYLSKRNVFAPSVLSCAIWVICLTLFCILPHRLPPLSWQFLGSLSIWITLLWLLSLFVQSFKHSVPRVEASKPIRDIFLTITIVTFPLYLMQVIPIATSAGSHWAWALRQYALDENTFSGFIVLLWKTTYLIELYYARKTTLWRTTLPAIIYLTFGFLSMAKITFFEFAVTTLAILYTQKRVHVKHLLVGILLLLAAFFIVQSIRQEQAFQQKGEKMDFIVLYALSSMSAFDTLDPYSAAHIGENTFRIYYAISYACGNETKPVDPILPFIQKPIITNTYTAMYPFFKDFGYIGVAIAAILLGLIFGYLFRGVLQNSAFFIIAYAYFANVIILQYVADIFMTNLAGHIKFILLLSIPFIVGHLKIFNTQTYE